MAVQARITDIGVKGDIYNRLSQTPQSDGLLGLALRTTSVLPAGSAEKFAWLGTPPSMRAWITERVMADPQTFNYAITNIKYESSGKLPLDLVNNDKVAEVQQWIGDFGALYQLWIKESIAAALSVATTLLAFDGIAYFATNHSYAKTGTFSNLVQSATTGGLQNSVTPIQAAYAINQAIQTLFAMPDDQGRVIKNEDMQEVSVVYRAGTQNAAAFQIAANEKMISAGSGMISNPVMGLPVKINWVASGLLAGIYGTSPTASSAFSVHRHVRDRGKSVIFQENEKDRLVSVISDPNSEFVFENDAWAVGLKTVGNVGYGWPSDAVLCQFAA